jgi:hypothetical protein
MPVYQDSQQLYKTMETLFTRLAVEYPHSLTSLAEAGLILRFKLSSPQAEIIVNGRKKPASVSYGKTVLRPDLDLELSADTLHSILMDEVSIRGSLANRNLKVSGPVWKTNSLGNILEAGKKIYPGLQTSLL